MHCVHFTCAFVQCVQNNAASTRLHMIGLPHAYSTFNMKLVQNAMNNFNAREIFCCCCAYRLWASVRLLFVFCFLSVGFSVCALSSLARSSFSFQIKGANNEINLFNLFFTLVHHWNGVGNKAMHSLNFSMTGCKIRCIEIYGTINDSSLSQLNWTNGHHVSRHARRRKQQRRRTSRPQRFVESQCEWKCVQLNSHSVADQRNLLLCMRKIKQSVHICCDIES